MTFSQGKLLSEHLMTWNSLDNSNCNEIGSDVHYLPYFSDLARSHITLLLDVSNTTVEAGAHNFTDVCCRRDTLFVPFRIIVWDIGGSDNVGREVSDDKLHRKQPYFILGVWCLYDYRYSYNITLMVVS